MTTTLTNRQVRLARRPEGAAKRDDWQYTDEPVAQPAEGGVLVKTLSISLDPAMRGWMNEGKSYIAPVEIGAVMRAGGIGRVVASRNPAFAVGDAVYGTLGVQQYALVPQEEIKRSGLVKIDLEAGTIGQWLNVLGMPGMTGYFGLMDVGLPKAGETVVVSGAAGAVGQTVGQLAKIKGCRVVGIAGGAAKCDWVVKELGFDACIDYKAGPSAVREGLKAHFPKGVDIYFDNVGGEILDTVLAKLARGARIIICGAISQYNNTTPVQGPKNYLSLLVNRARMQGIVVFDYADRYPVAIAEMSAYLKDGRMKSREDVVDGIDTFPEALTRLFTGENFGKLVLKISD
ncbi:NADP-dependent oxidoreductase [Variovorax sp. J22P168]|uniref:NADP-dependent oxidoreductase n=1 Tax=Variovorax jilinensis TaxID=3053513 RepID=UPI002575445C|nr:NADP-dependent oxidoreductase [Variovorax sp. J22P168]MDM0010840.1 NADP-dependent oxidoreductase [Variovorax sp. J22P168]